MIELVEILYTAFHSELGVCVQTDDPERLRQKLYVLRREHPDFDCLSFIISPLNPGDLWIIKQPKEKINAENT